MYNGIGLPTPRGSGTNGYVQKNLSFVGNKTFHVPCYEREGKKLRMDVISKEPNKEIMEHERKREVELKCLELQDLMEEQGCEASDIDFKVNEFRTALLARLKDEQQKKLVDAKGANGTAYMAEANEIKNSRMREALGIKDSYVEGSAFNFEEKKQQSKEEKAFREERELGTKAPPSPPGRSAAVDDYSATRPRVGKHRSERRRRSKEKEIRRDTDFQRRCERVDRSL